MSSTSWNTASGPRRVRRDPPTLAEAIAAAQGFIDDCDLQIDFAASLMGVAPAIVRAEIETTKVEPSPSRILARSHGKVGARDIVVERKMSRRRVDAGRTDLPRGDVSRAEAVRLSVLGRRR